jgi:hypothetical protein
MPNHPKKDNSMIVKTPKPVLWSACDDVPVKLKLKHYEIYFMSTDQ